MFPRYLFTDKSKKDKKKYNKSPSNSSKGYLKYTMDNLTVDNSGYNRHNLCNKTLFM